MIPKPGLRFGSGPARGGGARYPASQARDRRRWRPGLDIALNPATLPRLVVNRALLRRDAPCLRRQGREGVAGRSGWPMPTG
jgi:hypothetical protein